jgi:hypothetical protein
MSDARVRVSLTDGVIEFEGSETFVAGLVDRFGGVIHMALGGEQPDVNAAAKDNRRGYNGSDGAAVTELPVVNVVPEPVASARAAPDDSLGDIFAETEDGVQVLKLLRGANKASRTVTLAKLYLYGLQKLKQRDTAMFGEIAHVCRAHGCFNSHNMAAYLKADRESFIFGGKGKRQTLKLSAPGMEGTEALITRIRSGKKGILSRGQGIAARGQGIAADMSQISD